MMMMMWIFSRIPFLYSLPLQCLKVCVFTKLQVQCCYRNLHSLGVAAHQAELQIFSSGNGVGGICKCRTQAPVSDERIFSFSQ